jgi:hypothetical protein
MNRTTWLQERRMQKFRDLSSRWERKQLPAFEDAAKQIRNPTNYGL